MSETCSKCRHWRGPAGPGMQYCHRFMPVKTIVAGKAVYEPTVTPDGPCIYNPSEFSAPVTRVIHDPKGLVSGPLEIEGSPDGERPEKLMSVPGVPEPASIDVDRADTAGPEIPPVHVDKNGQKFDPRIHETDKQGNPVIAKNGTIRMKRGQIGRGHTGEPQAV